METQLTPAIDVEGLQTIAQSFNIETAAEFASANTKLGEVKTRRKQIVEFFAEPKQKAREAWQLIIAREKFFTDKLDEIISTINEKMLAWTKEQERIRRAEENRLRLEADARAEAERKKILAQAKRNDTLGNGEKAQEYRVKAEAVQAAPVFVPKQTPKVAGLSIREIWKVEITDKSAFVKAATENAMLQAFIEIDTTGLKTLAGKTEVPGIRFYKEQSLSRKI